MGELARDSDHIVNSVMVLDRWKLITELRQQRLDAITELLCDKKPNSVMAWQLDGLSDKTGTLQFQHDNNQKKELVDRSASYEAAYGD